MTFGNLVDGYLAWGEGLIDLSAAPLLYLLTHFLLAFASGLIVVLVILYLLYLFAKVFLGMLMRIALLAVLTALSPVAFAMYASDATSHWTKKWVSMFLGATFQQVVVLIVIYIGVSLIGEYLSRGVETDFSDLVFGMILAFLTLSLAAAVPDIVNPGGKGLFGSFTQAAGLALAATTVVASGGVAAAVGGIRGGFGGDSGSSPDSAGPSSPSGPSSPTGSGGAAQAAGPGIISSVGRTGVSMPVGPAPSQAATSEGSAPSGGAAPPTDASGGASPSGGGAVVPSSPPGGDAQPSDPGGGPADASEQSSQGDPGGDSGQRQRPGFFRRVGSGMARGWTSGTRWGSGMNLRAANLASGRSFYRHSSRGDDSAGQIERLRAEQEEGRDEMKDVFKRMRTPLRGGDPPLRTPEILIDRGEHGPSWSL